MPALPTITSSHVKILYPESIQVYSLHTVLIVYIEALLSHTAHTFHCSLPTIHIGRIGESVDPLVSLK